MITVKLRGGLGNQMFQYALGRALAERKQTNLQLDLSVYYNSIERHDYTLRGYELGAFNIVGDLILPPKVPILPGKIGKRISNVIHKAKIKSTKHIVKERQFHFNPKILSSPDNSYVNGYWHSEKYFKEIESKLREEFALKVPLSQKAIEVAEKIRKTGGISLHIRRGDYLTNTWAQKTYHILDLSYYRKSVEIIQEEQGLQHCYIFSDDPGWVKNHFNLPNQLTFVTETKNYEDLYLMSICSHNIIANSSFSWWGAWLNQYKNKKVVAPKNWFKDNKIDTKDLIPENWQRI